MPADSFLYFFGTVFNSGHQVTRGKGVAESRKPLIDISSSIQLLINVPANLEAYRRMVGVIRSKQSFAFAGAGVSRPLGYPTWLELLNRLASETRTRCGEDIIDGEGRPLTVTEVERIDDLLVQAEILKVNLKEQYGGLIREIFARKRSIKVEIKELARLPFQHILTSNYDVSLEVAHEELQLQCESICLCDGAAREFVNKLFDTNYGKRIVHVHGRFDKPESIVLTEKEYAALYQGSQVVERFWGAVPMYRTCVFLGFSFSDEEITESFNLRNFNRAHREGSQTPHFALLALADTDRDKERVLRTGYAAKYGVDPVFFDPVDWKYSGYSNVIENIAQDISPPVARGAVGQGHSPSYADDFARLEALTTLNMKKGATGELR